APPEDQADRSKGSGKPHASCRSRFREDESMRVLWASGPSLMLAWLLASPAAGQQANSPAALGVSLGRPQPIPAANPLPRTGAPEIRLAGFSSPVATAAKPVAYDQNSTSSNYPSPLPSWCLAPEPVPAARSGTFAADAPVAQNSIGKAP